MAGRWRPRRRSHFEEGLSRASSSPGVPLSGRPDILHSAAGHARERAAKFVVAGLMDAKLRFGMARGADGSMGSAEGVARERGTANELEGDAQAVTGMPGRARGNILSASICSFNDSEFQTSSERKGASEWRRQGITLDDGPRLNALNEDDWALHLMIGHQHVGPRPIQRHTRLALIPKGKKAGILRRG